jgi:hypothetical protein
MKHFPAILFIAAAVLCGSVSYPAQAAPILDFAVRVGCDFQQPEKGLMDLHILQGSTPLVLAMPQAGNTALTPDTDTSVRMIIGPSETGSIYAVRTNYAIAGGGYAIDWPTIGTNSSGQAWFYTLLFDREGKTYWSGSGALYIDASGYSGPDGVDWIEYTTPNVGWANVVGDPADNAALVQYVEDHGGGGGNLTATNTPTSGQMLYASGTDNDTLYWGNAPEGGGTGWTNLAFSGTGNAITGATAAGTTLTLERGTIEGGGGVPATNVFAGLPSILVSEDWTWTNQIYAVGADTSVTNISITLPDGGTNFTSVVVRKFSNLHQLRILRGTNVVYTLYDDGSTRSYDWWPQRTNWFWRN